MKWDDNIRRDTTTKLNYFEGKPIILFKDAFNLCISDCVLSFLDT